MSRCGESAEYRRHSAVHQIFDHLPDMIIEIEEHALPRNPRRISRGKHR
jgi:hypothetical protein